MTYTVKDKNNNINSRTVNMVLTGENYAQKLSLERLKKPWASYLYHGRGTLSTQGKKAWDLVLKELLDFNKNKWQIVNRWDEDVYLIDIDLQANGIFVKTDELSSLGYMLMDDEPRTFILKDWNCELTKKDGLAYHIKLWINKQSLKQDEWLQKIEENTVQMLSVMKSDMTEAQRLNVVSSKYKNWIKYGGNGQLLTDGLGNRYAVCGGNARGYVYLSERLGIKSVWGRSSSHAWSFTKISDYDYWFKTDLLSGEFLSPGVNGEGNLMSGGNYKIRHYKWFTFGTLEYPKKLLRYPSVWIELTTSKLILTKNKEYDLMSYILDYGSIFNDNYDKNDIEIKIDKIDENGNIIKENIDSFEIKGDGTNLKAGYYQIRYIISDKGKTNFATMLVRVTTGEEFNIGIENIISNGNVTTGKLGLWTGSEEKWYTNGIHIYEAGSITFNVENYRYLIFDFGIKNSVRENTQWGSNGKVAVKVVITTLNDEIVYEGSTLGWKTKYESVFLKLPDDAKKVTIYSLTKGSGNNHAGIGNLMLIKDDGLIESVKEENPPKLSKNEIVITSNKIIDLTKEFIGIDDEDGEFNLNDDNFKIDSLPIINGKYVSGIYKLNYELKDSDGNVQKGIVNVTVEAALYTVTFYYDDGIQKIKVKENERITAPNVSKSGYKLIGWFNKDKQFDFTTPITDDVTLVAKWEKNKVINIENNLTDENVTNSDKQNNDSTTLEHNQNEELQNNKKNYNGIEILNIFSILLCLLLIVLISYKNKRSRLN